MSSACKIILWVGAKHSGKTTAIAKLVSKLRAEGFKVAGILEPSIYTNEKLSGFDIIDLSSRKRTILARRKKDNEPFSFMSKGLKLGRSALSKKSTRNADLVIVDEFGPLELEGKGWRKCIDSIIKSGKSVLILVVREELTKNVLLLYNHKVGRKISFLDSQLAVIEQLRKISELR